MTIEQSLAAREIVKYLDMGYGREVAINMATKLVQSQGFGKKHSRDVAEKMAELV